MYHKIGTYRGDRVSSGERLLRTKLNLAKFNVKHTYGTLINWGCTQVPQRYTNILNKPEAIQVCANKTLTYDKLKEAEVPTIKWTLSKEEALAFGFPLLYRKNFLSKGLGIKIVENAQDMPLVVGETYFFSKFYKSLSEYRVHVFRDKLVGWSKKTPNEGAVSPIRSHNNGYRFSLRTDDIQPQLLEKAVKAVKAVGLDFGAVDVLLDDKNRYRVLEVNSAPGLDDGTILGKYVEQFHLIKVAQ